MKFQGCALLAAALPLVLSLVSAHALPAMETTATETPSPSGAGQHGGIGHPATPGYLGVDLRDVNDDEVSALRLKDARGAEIVSVDHDGPAGKMGLHERDVVLQMNGIAIDDEDQIRRMLREYGPGRPVALVISRDGQTLSLQTQMADKNEIEKQAWQQHLQPAPGPQAPSSALPTGDVLPANAAAAVPAPVPASRYSKSFLGTLLMSPSYTGLLLDTMKPQLAQFFGVPNGAGGLLVKNVDDNSPAAMAGLRAGDVIVRANQGKVASVSAWTKAVREAKGRPVAVEIMRDKQARSLTLTPDSKKRSGLDPLSLPMRPDEDLNGFIRVVRVASLEPL